MLGQLQPCDYFSRGLFKNCPFVRAVRDLVTPRPIISAAYFLPYKTALISLKKSLAIISKQLAEDLDVSIMKLKWYIKYWELKKCFNLTLNNYSLFFNGSFKVLL